MPRGPPRNLPLLTRSFPPRAAHRRTHRSFGRPPVQRTHVSATTAPLASPSAVPPLRRPYGLLYRTACISGLPRLLQASSYPESPMVLSAFGALPYFSLNQNRWISWSCHGHIPPCFDVPSGIPSSYAFPSGPRQPPKYLHRLDASDQINSSASQPLSALRPHRPTFPRRAVPALSLRRRVQYSLRILRLRARPLLSQPCVAAAFPLPHRHPRLRPFDSAEHHDRLLRLQVLRLPHARQLSPRVAEVLRGLRQRDGSGAGGPLRADAPAAERLPPPLGIAARCPRRDGNPLPRAHPRPPATHRNRQIDGRIRGWRRCRRLLDDLQLHRP